MGNVRQTVDDITQRQQVMEVISKIAGQLTSDEIATLLSGDGFVRVPTEELRRQRVDAYAYLM